MVNQARMGTVSKVPGYGKALFRDHGPDFSDAVDMEDPNMPLYALQSKVPRLPVPDLDTTFELFLKSVEPHVNPEEFKETKRKVAAFRSSGIADKCNARLLALKEKRDVNSSWFNALWNEYAYLGYRGSVVWNVTYFLQFADELPGAMVPTRRAARIVYHSLEFKGWVASGSLSPDMAKGGVPMSNSQYKYMFNTARMPGHNGVDFVRTYAPDVYNHIVVARKNRFFVFNAVAADGQRLSVDALQTQLERIRAIADRQGTDAYSVGVLTADNRDNWFANRELLVNGLTLAQCANNKRTLELIESASLMLCLDDTAPTTREEVGRQLLNADGRNRYWDKSLQFIVFENGKSGFAGEHAMMDGTTSCRMINHVLDRMFEVDTDAVKYDAASPHMANLMPEPEQMVFELDGAARDAIVKAGRAFDEEMATKDLSVLMFHGYGKQRIKKFKVSPDAFAQLAIQYAYYRTFGVFRGTYESTQTRSYLHGRTEVTRSVTNDSKAFCEAMMAGSASPKDLYALLVKATQAHSVYIGKAAKAQGCDRHLLGLKMMLQPGEAMPELFSDDGFLRSGTWAISTSGLTGEYMDGWGFGEVVPQGVGIGYSVQDNRLRFTISSRHGWTARLKANMETTLLQMRDLCEMAIKQPQSKL